MRETPWLPVADEAASPLLARQAAASAGVQSVSNVEGSFSYDQGSLSSTSYIAEVFNKAAASLCASLPDYGIVQGSPRVTVDGDVDNAFEATVDEMAEGKGAKTLVMACACRFERSRWWRYRERGGVRRVA